MQKKYSCYKQLQKKAFYTDKDLGLHLDLGIFSWILHEVSY